MASVGERLKDAIDIRMGSIRKFEREMERVAPDLRGTSRQTLYRYFSGETDPGPGVLRAAAEVLKVREEWLGSGSGGMTDDHRRVCGNAVRRAVEAAARKITETDHQTILPTEALTPGSARSPPHDHRSIRRHCARDTGELATPQVAEPGPASGLPTEGLAPRSTNAGADDDAPIGRHRRGSALEVSPGKIPEPDEARLREGLPTRR